jgi:hypothetical protein
MSLSSKELVGLCTANSGLNHKSKETMDISKRDYAYDASSTSVLYRASPPRKRVKTDAKGLATTKPLSLFNSADTRQRLHAAEILFTKSRNFKKMNELAALLQARNLVNATAVVDFPFHDESNVGFLEELVACVDDSQRHVVRNALSRERVKNV